MVLGVWVSLKRELAAAEVGSHVYSGQLVSDDTELNVGV